MDWFVQDSEKLVRFSGLTRGISKSCKKDIKRDSGRRIQLYARQRESIPNAKASSEFGSLLIVPKSTLSDLFGSTIS